MNTTKTFDQVAADTITAAVKALAAQYPQLGLSFGYIGDLGRNYDDRSWRVFTKLVDKTGRSVSFGYHSTEELADLAARVERGDLAAFCARHA